MHRPQNEGDLTSMKTRKSHNAVQGKSPLARESVWEAEREIDGVIAGVFEKVLKNFQGGGNRD